MAKETDTVEQALIALLLATVQAEQAQRIAALTSAAAQEALDTLVREVADEARGYT